MRNNGQIELCQQAEENANMLLRELKRTVTVNEIAFVSFPERMPSIVPLLDTNGEPIFNNNTNSKYLSDAVSNVAVIIVRLFFISSFLFYCLLSNHSFQTNPNRMANCFKLFFFYYNLQLHCSCVAFIILQDSKDSKDSQEEEEVDTNRTTVEATLCVGDVINIDDTSDWWNILSINCETASIQVRLSSTLVGKGNGVLRFSTIRKRFNSESNSNMEEMSVEDREEEKEELEAMVEHTIRWMTIQEAQCRSGE